MSAELIRLLLPSRLAALPPQSSFNSRKEPRSMRACILALACASAFAQQSSPAAPKTALPPAQPTPAAPAGKVTPAIPTPKAPAQKTVDLSQNERLEMENILLRAQMVQEEEASLPQRKADLQSRYNDLMRRILAAHPGYTWNPQTGALVPTPAPQKTAAPAPAAKPTTTVKKPEEKK